MVVCAAFSGRLDHTLAAVGTLAAAPTCCRPSSSRAVRLAAECRASRAFEIGPAGTTWSLLAVSVDARLSVTGVRGRSFTAHLEPLSSLGVSNIVTAPVGHVVVHSGVVFAINPLLEAFAAIPHPKSAD